MAQVYFNCSNSNGRLLDRRIAEVDDLFEARDYAVAHSSLVLIFRIGVTAAYVCGMIWERKYLKCPFCR
jgi:hypothetical protein